VQLLHEGKTAGAGAPEFFAITLAGFRKFHAGLKFLGDAPTAGKGFGEALDFGGWLERGFFLGGGGRRDWKKNQQGGCGDDAKVVHGFSVY
jgi:hypothetical protein